MAIKLDDIFDDEKFEIDPQRVDFLKNLQANILKGHGREYVALIFFEIKHVDKARDFLSTYPVSDSFSQLTESEKFKQTGEPGGVVRLVFLSKSGLDKFGKSNDLSDAPFQQKMKEDPSVLDFGVSDFWQNELKKEIDILLLIAFHEEHTLSRIVGKLVDKIANEESGFFKTIFIQEGRAYKNGDGEGVEHFGYVDGRSQPLFLKSAYEEEIKVGKNLYDPKALLSQFIFKDPLSASDNSFGSYFVFRKLEQNVASFKEREGDLARELGLSGEGKERAGAMVVGRFEDGTPLVIRPEEGGVPVINNFNYEADLNGSKCPFHSHIRKTNPRRPEPVDEKGFTDDLKRQMARRGITYGTRLQHPDTKEFIDKPNDGVGLLFMSYQKSIEDQFHFMQTQWANNEFFPSFKKEDKDGIDPIIGQASSPEAVLANQKWLTEYGSAKGNKKEFLFKGFVSLKGGEYFYAPSISGLRTI